MKSNPEPPDSQSNSPTDRRDFVKACCAVAVGGVASAVPLAAGLNFVSDPLRRKTSAATGFHWVANLNSLPEDGQPRKFAVVADKSDAWNRFPLVPIGAVYLRRLPGDGVEALNVICPHAGCAVDYQSERKSYLCPCHNSSFALDGSLADKASPSARRLDSLDVEIREGGQIWVKFMNFRAGSAQKVPLV